MDSDAGLGAMRAAIAATEAVATVPPASTHLALAQPIPRFGDAGRKQVAHLAKNCRGLCPASAEQDPHRHGANACRWSKPGE